MINSASESKSMKSQLSLKKKINNISVFVKFLSLVEIRQKIEFLEGFTAFFKKCYEFLDFASFGSFKEVTFFASILLVFHRKSWRSYLWILQDHTYSFSTKLALFNDFVAKRRYFYEKSSIFFILAKTNDVFEQK